MGILVAGFDVHRAQITFDALDTETGEIATGRIRPNPEAVVQWVGRFGPVENHHFEKVLQIGARGFFGGSRIEDRCVSDAPLTVDRN